MPLKTSQLIFFAVCMLLLAAYGCKKDMAQPASQITKDEDSRHYSFLALGDSYTIGQSVTEAQRFPAQTQSMLNAVGKHVDKVQYIAATGWTTINLQGAIEQQQPQGPFDIITLLIGVNDQSQVHDTTGYRDRFAKLIQTAVTLTGDKPQHVFVLSIPDYSVTPLGAIDDTMLVRKRIDLFNNINLSISNTYKTSFTDVNILSKEASYDASLIAADSLHFSGKMYRKWADLLVPKIKEVLN